MINNNPRVKQNRNVTVTCSATPAHSLSLDYLLSLITLAGINTPPRILIRPFILTGPFPPTQTLIDTPTHMDTHFCTEGVGGVGGYHPLAVLSVGAQAKLMPTKTLTYNA